ncbi:MAG: hypothetical protein KBA31_02155 [Alphaproteobacteria bacterium]|nr:hypothetical protein [Alphaproteobacteria bacterium]
MKFATTVATAMLVASSAVAAEAPRIIAIHAQLYHEGSGKLSAEDLLAPDAPGMWNTIIGDNASNFTLVTVEVQGKDVPVGAVKVQLVARGYKRRIMEQRTIDVSLYDAKTTFFAPLWLYDTGCDEIEVSARLIGKGVSGPTVKKVIPFKCGE